MKGIVVLAALAVLGPAGASAQGTRRNTVEVVLTDFKIGPPAIHVHVGDEVAMTIRNAGKVAHEWLAGREIVRTADEKGFRNDLFALLKPKIEGRQYAMLQAGRRPPGRDEQAARTSTGVVIQPGGAVTLHFTVPESAKGEWEMACFFTGHFESGMRGTLVAE